MKRGCAARDLLRAAADGGRRPVAPFHSLDDDDRAGVESQCAIVPPGPKLRAQVCESLALSAADCGILEAVGDGQLQVGHPSSWLEREESPVAGLQEVESAREAAYPGNLEADKRATVNDIENEDRNASSSAAATKSFLDDLTCE